MQVFVVEDQPAVLKSLLKGLAPFRDVRIVGTAFDGETAVEQVASLRPDVVLLDLELPGIDGIEVTKRLKARLPAVEILILTSFDDETKVYEAIQAGASGYLVKRLGADKIREALTEVVNGGTVIEAVIAKRFWHYFQSLKAAANAPEARWHLTAVELDVVRFLAKGLSNAEVGAALQIDRRVVKTHLANLYLKMGVRSHVEVVVLAIKAGLIDV